MKSAVCLGGDLLFALGSSTFAVRAGAQNQEPAKYLYVINIELKPGHSGEFLKLEGEKVAAARSAKSPAFYLGTWPITGNGNRLLFISGFPTYGDLEKNYIEIMSKPAVAAVMNKNDAAQGELSVSEHGSIYEYRKDRSLRAGVDLEKAREARVAVFDLALRMRSS